MNDHPVSDAPAGTMPAAEFYRADPRRSTSRTLSYGSRWVKDGWTWDPNHVVELYWLGATHELVAFYVRYDWTQVDPAELTTSASEVVGEDFGSGLEVGHVLGVLADATDEIYVEVLAVLSSDLECHEVMFGWHWVQHHPDGFAQIRRRLRERGLTATR
jgi:hypothetical protein